MGIRSTRNRLAVLIIISSLWCGLAHAAALRTLDSGAFVSYCKQYDFAGSVVTNTGMNCTVTESGGASAPADATFITQTINGTLTNEQAMSALASGLVYNTTATGVQSIATAGVDYIIPAGNVATATALAADPSDCGANVFATSIDAGANLTCSAIVDADVPDNITVDLAAAATALAANPTDCAVNNYATAIDASGNLTCSVPSGFDSTAVDDTTWSDGANASNIWTFDVSGTDHTMTMGDDSVAFSGALTAANFSGTNTGDQSSIVGITGTTAEFNTALSDGSFATGGGTATGANTGDQSSIVGISGTTAEFNTALSDGSFATGGGTATGSNTGDQINITGNAATVTTNANLTGGVTSVGNAATVITNANLTGVVTSVGNATAIADKALAIAKLADGTDGQLITWDAAGVIATVATGTDTQVLTSNGADTAPTFQDPAGGGAYTLVSATAFSAATTTGDISVDVSKIYLITFDMTTDAQTANAVTFRCNNDATSYGYVVRGYAHITGDITTSGVGAASIPLGTIDNSDWYRSMRGQLYLYTRDIDLAVDIAATLDGTFGYHNTSNGGQASCTVSAHYESNTAISSFEFNMGVASTGTVYLYELTLS